MKPQLAIFKAWFILRILFR